MEQLDLNSCKNNKEVTNLVKARVNSIPLPKLIKNLSDDFVYQDETIRKIYVALATGKNSILYGTGGFGKSVIVKAICEELGLPMAFKVGHKGMTAEELLGVPNMKKLLNDSEYEVAFENSVFAQKKILILEEFGDVDPSVVAVLKDIITSKGFLTGDEKKESFVPNIIITSNKTPDELSSDDSTSAFFKDRFPIRQHVKWDLMEASNYLEFFRVYFKERYFKNFEKFNLLSKLCEQTSTIVSPRIASEAGDILLDLGIEYIDTVEDIDTHDLTRWIKETELETQLFTEKEILSNFRNFLVGMVKVTDNLDTILKEEMTLQKVATKLRSQTFSDSNLVELSNVMKIIDERRSINLVHYNKLFSGVLDTEINELTTWTPKIT